MIKLFSIASGEDFVYDAMTNRIITLHVKHSADKADLAAGLCLAGQVCNEPLRRIAFPFGIEEYRRKLKRQIPRLTLEITQQCNMRCAYCIYSGCYGHMRTHSAAHMDWDMVRRCIDFYASHNIDCAEADISFYGGEALLEFDLIRAAAAYARNKFDGRPLHMSISSNGILLTREVAAWLSENPDVSVTVTLNGPYHDRYRRLAEGGGSLEPVMDRLRYIRQRYPAVWERQILLICNITSAEEVAGIRRFYLDRVGKVPVLITGIVAANGNDRIRKILSCGKKDDERCRMGLKRLYLEENDPFLHRYFWLGLSEIHDRRIFAGGADGLPGSCAPFLSQIFVAADGRFQICEKVCGSLDLGDIAHGLNMSGVEALYRGMVGLYNKKCRDCWAQRLCTVCCKDFVGKAGLYHEIPDEICKAMQDSILENLKLYCEMAYHYPPVFHRYRHE